MHRDTHTCAHMQSQVSSITMAVISLSLETDILNNFLVFSFNMFFPVFPLCKELGIFLYLFFPLNRGIFGVYFCEYRYDQHIPNKPVSSAYVQF